MLIYLDMPYIEPISQGGIPQNEFFVQFAAVGSKRYPLVTLPDGTTSHRVDLPEDRWVSYNEVDLGRLRLEPDKTKALAELLNRKIEAPRFLSYSSEMPYSVDDFERMLRRPGAILMLAWEGKVDLVGYAYSAPYAVGDIGESIDCLPPELRIVPELGRKGGAVADIVYIGEDVVRLTPENTWVHDSFAAFKGIGVGTIFQNRMLERVFLMAGERTKLVTFAVTGAYTESMLDRSPLLQRGRVMKCKVPYRGTTATLIINNLELMT